MCKLNQPMEWAAMAASLSRRRRGNTPSAARISCVFDHIGVKRGVKEHEFVTTHDSKAGVW